ncbi:MAG TPA: CAP domain-containing protein [Longimicrobiaceae bacterium]|jgi:uncharacterized protein YkwD
MRLRHLPAVLLALVLAACAAPPLPARAPTPEEVRDRAERQVLALVNSYRQGLALNHLRRDDHLTRVAREHSEAAARGERTFSHDGLDRRARHVGERVPFLEVGENLYSRQPASPLSAWYAVTGWLESPAHLELIEGCFDLAGVGMADDGRGRVYYTLLFVLRARRSTPDSRAAAAPGGRSCR